MTRYDATSAATRKNRPLSTGFDTLEAAKAQALFLASTYGGVAKVTTDGDKVVAKFSLSKGWH
jgi:hypothetical protein